MDIIPLSSVESAIDLTTIGIVFLALYYVVRQRLNRMFGAKILLVVVYLAFASGLLLEFFGDVTSNQALLTLYAFGEVGLILLTVMLLTATAYAFYFPGLSLRERVGSAFGGRHQADGVLLLLLAAYCVFLEAYLILARPLAIVDISSAGTVLTEVKFDFGYLLLLFVVLVAYLLYPLPLFIRAARGRGMLLCAKRCWFSP